MPWGIGYTICTILAIIVAVRAMWYQRGRGRGPITGFVVGIVAGSVMGIFLMAMMIILATPERHIEEVNAITHEQAD